MDKSIADSSLYRIDVSAIDIPGVSAASLTRAPQTQPVPEPPPTTTTQTPPSSTAPSAATSPVTIAASPVANASVVERSTTVAVWLQWLFVAVGIIALLLTTVALGARRHRPTRHSRHSEPAAHDGGVR
jgi:hypothetical protein